MPEKEKAKDVALEYVPHGLSRRDTKIVITELRKIEAAHGIIQPRVVVEAAKPAKSPLHKFFEWDQVKAAGKYREFQARQLICRVYVRDAALETSEPVRAFVNIKSEVEGDDDMVQGYVSQGTMLKAPGLQQQVLTYARDQLLLWRKKFGNYQQFYGVAKAIDELVSVKDNAA